jgi:Protein of unknown function (DUF4236)
MGFRFTKRARIAPGVTINLSKGGVSTSVGPRGAKLTIGPKGRRTTVGGFGTGLFWTDYQRWGLGQWSGVLIVIVAAAAVFAWRLL